MAKKSNSSQDLLSQVKQVVKRLGNLGWSELLLRHGLDLSAADLRTELLRPLQSINRDVPGFEEFAWEGRRGIEPGNPARSLLFHALASPAVVKKADGKPFQDDELPTPAEIEAVENLVYGISPPSMDEIRVRAGNAPLAIVVFAREYRPAIDTVHRKHADFCFSRVGVSRVGTAKHKYLPAARGYLPFDAENPKAIRVLPCRFAAYLAVQLTGQPDRFGPFRFQSSPRSDAERKFWVPLHKLFRGPQCIRNLDLSLSLTAKHINERLRRAHLALGGGGYDTGWHNPDLNQPPFILKEGLAEFSTEEADGEGLLVPIYHPTLVKEARVGDKLITYQAPKNREPFRSSVIIDSKPSGARSGPEYIHVRHRMEPDGTMTDLNDQPNIRELIKEGGYQAIHYIDHTADGYIDIECPELALELPRSCGAYSLVSAVDFFPLVRQQQLMQWWNQSVPPDLSSNIWPSNPGPPEALCDFRAPANLNMSLDKLTTNSEAAQHNQLRPVFESTDDTISAIVGLLDSSGSQLTRLEPPVNQRSSCLSDGAAGVFAPGWDTSIDRTDETSRDDNTIAPGVTFFSNYGLGSPFPEDAMLCAALSSYWPAAAPDITRTFAPGNYATATPLTDDQLGWDGNPPPFIPDTSVKEVEYRTIEYSDYVNASLKNEFNFHSIATTTTAEYIARTLTMARAYAALGAVTREQKRIWAVFSFKAAIKPDSELEAAELEAGAHLSAKHTYRFLLFKHIPVASTPSNHRNRLVGFKEMLTVYADPHTVILKDNNDKWIARRY